MYPKFNYFRFNFAPLVLREAGASLAKPASAFEVRYRRVIPTLFGVLAPWRASRATPLLVVRIFIAAFFAGALVLPANAADNDSLFGRRIKPADVDIEAIANQKYSVENTFWTYATSDEARTLEFSEKKILRQIDGKDVGSLDWRDYGNGQYIAGSSIFTIAADGTELIERSIAGTYVCTWRRSKKPENFGVEAPVRPVANHGIFAGTAWRNDAAGSPSTPSTYFFNSDGTFTETWNGTAQRGTWLQRDEKSLKAISDFSRFTFTLSIDGTALLRSGIGFWKKLENYTETPETSGNITVGTTWSNDTASPDKALSVDITTTQWENPRHFNSVYSFNKDGTFTEDFYALGRTIHRDGKWEIISKDVIKTDGVHIITINADGNFTRFDQAVGSPSGGVWRRKAPAVSASISGITSANGFAGTIWTFDVGNGKEGITEFHEDGTFRHFDGKSEYGGRWEATGTKTAHFFTEQGARASVWTLLDDKNLKQDWGYGKRTWYLKSRRQTTQTTDTRAGETNTPPVPENVKAVTMKDILSGETYWRGHKFSTSTYCFLPDGSWNEIYGGLRKNGQWKIVRDDTLQLDRDRLEFVLTENGNKLLRNDGATWYRVSGIAATREVAGKIRTFDAGDGEEVAGFGDSGSTRRFDETMPPAFAQQYKDLSDKFDAAYRQSVLTFNDRDKNSLERIRQRVISANDIEMAEKLKIAIDAVQAGDAFDAEEPGRNKKLTQIERELWQIKLERDKVLTNARKTVAGRFKSAFEQLQREALRKDDFKTANLAKEFLEVSTQPIMVLARQIEETSWQCDSPATIYNFKKNNVFNGSDYSKKAGDGPWTTSEGTWKILPGGTIQVKVEKGSWAFGTTKAGTYNFRLSPGGTLMTRDDGKQWTQRKK